MRYNFAESKGVFMNLVEIIQNQMGSQMVGQISYLIGEDSTKTQTALKAALPALLGGMMNKASTPEGANDVSKILAKLNDNAIASIPGLLASGKADSLAQQGSSMLTTLLGEINVAELSSSVASFSGINEAASDKLMGVLGPIAMGNMKQSLMSNGGISSTNISSVLLAQKDRLISDMPEGFKHHFAQSASFLAPVLPNLGSAAPRDSSSFANDVFGQAANSLAAEADTFATASELDAEQQERHYITGISEAGLDAVSDFSDRSQAFASDAFKDAQNVAENAGDSLKASSANVAASFDDAFEASKDFAANFADEASDFSQDAFGNAAGLSKDSASKLNNRGSKVMDGVTNFSDSSMDAFEDIGQKSLRGLGSAVNASRGLASEGVDKASGAVSASVETATHLSSSSWDEATDMAGKAADSVADVGDKAASTKLKYGRILIPALIAAVAILLILNLFR